LAGLVSLNAAYLPAAENPIGDAALIEKFSPLADRQFIYVANDEGMRNILVAQAFLVLQVKRILDAAAPGESDERR
jgi:hypothetical protein